MLAAPRAGLVIASSGRQKKQYILPQGVKISDEDRRVGNAVEPLGVTAWAKSLALIAQS
jgi:hypothetical protein